MVFGNMELFHIEPYISTIINFRLKYGSKIVAPNTNESSRNRRNRSNNNKEKVIKTITLIN